MKSNLKADKPKVTNQLQKLAEDREQASIEAAKLEHEKRVQNQRTPPAERLDGTIKSWAVADEGKIRTEALGAIKAIEAAGNHQITDLSQFTKTLGVDIVSRTQYYFLKNSSLFRERESKFSNLATPLTEDVIRQVSEVVVKYKPVDASSDELVEMSFQDAVFNALQKILLICPVHVILMECFNSVLETADLTEMEMVGICQAVLLMIQPGRFFEGTTSILVLLQFVYTHFAKYLNCMTPSEHSVFNYASATYGSDLGDDESAQLANYICNQLHDNLAANKLPSVLVEFKVETESDRFRRTSEAGIFTQEVDDAKIQAIKSLVSMPSAGLQAKNKGSSSSASSGKEKEPATGEKLLGDTKKPTTLEKAIRAGIPASTVKSDTRSQLNIIEEESRRRKEDEEIERANSGALDNSRKIGGIYAARASAGQKIQKLRNFSDSSSGVQSAEGIALTISDLVLDAPVSVQLDMVYRAQKFRFDDPDLKASLDDYLATAKQQIANKRVADHKVVVPAVDYRIVEENYRTDLRLIPYVKAIRDRNPKAKWDHVLIVLAPAIELLVEDLFTKLRPANQKLFYQIGIMSVREFNDWHSLIARKFELAQYLIMRFYGGKESIAETAEKFASYLQHADLDGDELLVGNVKDCKSESDAVIQAFNGGMFMDPMMLLRTYTYKKSVYKSDENRNMIMNIFGIAAAHVKLWDKINDQNRMADLTAIPASQITFKPQSDFMKLFRACFSDNKVVLRDVKNAIKPLHTRGFRRNAAKAQLDLEEDEIQHMLDTINASFDDEYKEVKLKSIKPYKQRLYGARVPAFTKKIASPSEEDDSEDTSAESIA